MAVPSPATCTLDPSAERVAIATRLTATYRMSNTTYTIKIYYVFATCCHDNTFTPTYRVSNTTYTIKKSIRVRPQRVRASIAFHCTITVDQQRTVQLRVLSFKPVILVCLEQTRLCTFQLIKEDGQRSPINQGIVRTTSNEQRFLPRWSVKSRAAGQNCYSSILFTFSLLFFSFSVCWSGLVQTWQEFFQEVCQQ